MVAFCGSRASSVALEARAPESILCWKVRCLSTVSPCSHGSQSQVLVALGSHRATGGFAASLGSVLSANGLPPDPPACPPLLSSAPPKGEHSPLPLSREELSSAVSEVTPSESTSTRSQRSFGKLRKDPGGSRDVEGGRGP